MRIRTIKPEFFLHETLGELSSDHKIAYIGLWCIADREGRFKWRPKMIKAQVFPYDQKLDIESILNDLIDNKFIVKYYNGDTYGLIPAFNKHQRINVREAKSTIPEPIIEKPNQNKEEPSHMHARAEKCKHMGKGREGKGKEGKGKDTPLPPSGDDESKLRKLEIDNQRIIRLLKIFNPTCRGIRKFTDTEIRAWKKRKGDITDQHLELIEKFYRIPKSQDWDETWNRKLSYGALLNQWHAQVDAAQAFFAKNQSIGVDETEPDIDSPPPNWKARLKDLKELNPTHAELHYAQERWGWNKQKPEVKNLIRGYKTDERESL